MTMFDSGANVPPDDADDAKLDALLSLSRPLEADSAFQSSLLHGFDARTRRKGARKLLTIFAEALGWRALARPMAAASLLAGICMTGFVAGAAASPSDGETYAELSAAFDQSFNLSEDTVSWAKE
jgi:hypothetical protein